MPVIIKDAGPFKILYDPPPGTNLIVAMGGRGGRKTYEVSKYIAYSCAVKKKRAVILRDEKALIKETILNEIWTRYETANSSGRLDLECIKNETELKDRKTGKTLLYTKGFRATTLEKTANMKGPSDIDIAVIEEGEDIRSKEMFDTFVDGLRKADCIVIVVLNTPSLQHFIVKRLFNATPVLDELGEPTGYFTLTPKEIPGFLCIQTSFKDNPFLPPHIVERYNGYGDPKHHLFDLHHYFTAILGYASTGRKGQIFTKFKPIPLAKYRDLRLTEFYGQDFGTASPAALIGVKIDGNTAYVRLLNYKPMDVLEIGKLYCQLKLTKSNRIICDYAGSEQIKKLKGGFKNLAAHEYETYPALANGFYTVNCPTKDIEGDISLIRSMEIFCVEEDIELWEEVNNYCYAQDKFGNYVDAPIDDYNHCFVSNTQILTNTGLIDIGAIKPGDMVMTTSGFKEVLKKFNNGKKQTFNYCLQFDTFCVNLQCTKNHLIKTTTGWVEVSELTTHQIYLSNFITGKNINYTQEKDIFQEGAGDCMSSFGKQKINKGFQRVFMFTMLTKIHSIIIHLIWNSRKLINIWSNTVKAGIQTILSGLRNFILRESRLQRSGIHQKTVLRGIANTVKKHGKTESHKPLPASNVVKITNPCFQQDQNSVITTARLRHLEIGESNYEFVYDLMVDEVHEYIANGVVVHNCMDALRYVIADQRGKQKMFGV